MQQNVEFPERPVELTYANWGQGVVMLKKQEMTVCIQVIILFCLTKYNKCFKLYTI